MIKVLTGVRGHFNLMIWDLRRAYFPFLIGFSLETKNKNFEKKERAGAFVFCLALFMFQVIVNREMRFTGAKLVLLQAYTRNSFA